LLHQSLRLPATELLARRRQVDACNEAHDIDRERCPACIVEIVDVEIAEPVIATEGAEIFQVQIAADEHARRAEQGVRTRQKIEKKRIGSAKECERIPAAGARASSSGARNLDRRFALKSSALFC
jgi:hypothetical protein